MVVKEGTNPFATEVGRGLVSAITFKRVLAPKERNATTYMRRNAPSHLTLRTVARRAQPYAHSSPEELVSSAMLVGTNTEAALIAAPPTAAKAKAETNGTLNPIRLLLLLPPFLPDVIRSRRKLERESNLPYGSQSPGSLRVAWH